MAAPEVARLDAYQIHIHLLWLGVNSFADRGLPAASGSAPWRLSVCDEVGASLKLGERSIALPARRVALIPPLSASANPDGDVRQLLVWFEPSAGSAALLADLGAAPIVLGPDDLRDELCARLRHDLATSAAIDAATCARATALVQLSVAAALELARGTELATEPTDDAERQLRPVLRYIDAHLGEPLENARLAAFVHASESHFIRLFRRVVGCTPARHVQDRRVHRAAELLARTSLGIDEIAERCGFANRFHFSRVFAQHMLEPPARYRALRGGAPSERAAGVAT